MQIISGTTRFQLSRHTAAAIGKFDGLHRGHQALLAEILKARQEGLLAAVFTFDPSPAAFFSGKLQKGLMTKEEKRRFFRQLGVDVLIEFPMNAQTAAIRPETFITDILCEKMQARLIVAGADLSFGDQGKGDCRLLQAYAQKLEYQVRIIDKVYEGETEISSTRVRKEVEAGHMEAAAVLLGAPYAVMGNVVHGRKIGRTLGFPTVNLEPPADKLLPPNGVYWSEVECRHGIFRGITNIGQKPTIDQGSNPPIGVETYLYDFHEDMYDSFITVRLLSFQRPERKFESLEALKKQLQKDIEAGRICH